DDGALVVVGVAGRWSVVGGRWLVADGRWSVVSGQWWLIAWRRTTNDHQQLTTDPDHVGRASHRRASRFRRAPASDPTARSVRPFNESPRCTRWPRISGP